MSNIITNEQLLNAVLRIGENQVKLRDTLLSMLEKMNKTQEDISNIKEELNHLRLNNTN